ncbi:MULTISPECIES: glycoside hydrolase family 43 protein [unclassified Cellvibrio]|uniref:glycoside hydrolase family 43 protein n=1 Tax=unclassified Cellvibrio TaxID=2624793 RepID=UPI0007853F9F|nr:MULTISPECIES: glycoside hydrolase family 43 protein [unclassified Cellvibrio]QEY16998.1 glycoside hydrolase family 43 protein [Cellvibrio sp. KY-GH-1]
MNNIITNPILRGFNPDPSIIRVDDVFYIATSTFEWFPGVQIHRSRNLSEWQLVGQALNRKSQLDMKGTPDSCGVWAPCLSYSNGIFYLVYSNVRSFDGPWKDTPNYLVTTTNIEGSWSEPTYLNSNGFDASLYHDEDGKKWLVNMVVDHRNGRFFGGIQLQEFDTETKELIGDTYDIFPGTELGCTEGPHIYKRNGWYYLLTAEGGTEYGHAVSIARSRAITGPYELHPHNPIVTAKDDAQAHFQRTGHGDLVETATGQWYAVYLGSRPLMPRRRCILGRETLIEEIVWENDWPQLSHPEKTTRLHIQGLNAPSLPYKPAPSLDHFNETNLSLIWQSLRVPINESWLSLHERPGYLRLRGRESLSSTHSQSFIARRLQAFHVQASCQLDFQPESFQQMAGLVCYYNTNHYIYLYVSAADAQPNKNQLKIMKVDNGVATEPETAITVFSRHEPVHLKLNWNKSSLQFSYSHTNAPGSWVSIGPELDGSILSDDYVRYGGHKYRAAFTGAFIGLNCQDLTGKGITADFDWFSYEEFDE